MSTDIQELIAKIKEIEAAVKAPKVEEVKEVKPEVKKPAAKRSMTSKIVTLEGSFKIERGLYEVLKRNLTKNINTLLIGETGCGKTEVVAHIAKDLGLTFNIMDMGTMTDPISGLIGIHTVTIVDGKTTSTFKKSRFSQLIQQPGIILLDELSRASTQANNLLFPCLDFRRQLSMEYCFEDQTPIQVHPNCVFIATANLGSQYTGTHKIDRALLDRFMTIRVNTPESADIRASLKVSYPEVATDNIVTIVKIYDNILAAHNAFKIDFKLSFRHLKYITAMVQDSFTIYDAFYAICKGLTGIDDVNILKDIIEVGTPKSRVEETVEEEEEKPTLPF